MKLSARMRTLPFLAACLLTVSTFVGNVHAAPVGNILDATYSVDQPGETSGNGITGFGVAGNRGTVGKAVAVQQDGKVVVVGTLDLGGGDTDSVVLRYNVDGTPDTSFGTAGAFTWGGPAADAGNAVAIQTDGKIVVVGTYNNGNGNTWIMAYRLNTNGTFDTSFNGSGEIVFTSAGADSGNGVAIDSNGKIVIAGTDDLGVGGKFLWVARLNPNGTYDNTFNPVSVNSFGNIALSRNPGEDATGMAVAVQPDNKIVVTGSADNGNGTTVMWVVRLTTAGVLDTTFNSTGDIAIGSNGRHIGNAVAIDAVGKIVLVGTYDWNNHVSNSAQQTDIWLQRLNSNGTPDTTFFVNGGTGGVTYGGTGNDTGSGVLVQPDGMILVVGTFDQGANTAAWIQRVKDNGQPSTTFNGGQPFFTISGTGNFAGAAAALQNGPNIILAGTGSATNGSTSTLMTARLFGNSYPLTVTITGNGTVTADKGTLLYNGTVGTEYYYPNEVVTLTPAPAVGNAFSAWGGACLGQGATCTVTMDAAKDVTATFSAIIPRLTVNMILNGNPPSIAGGAVNSSPGGISCTGGSCSENFTPFGTSVTLTATPAWHTIFNGWTGDCTGTGSCAVTMDAAQKTVDATFSPNYRVRVTGTPSNTTKDYSIIGNDYQTEFPGDASLTLLAQAFAFPEVLTYNLPLAMNFNGGMSSDFLSVAGFTTLSSPFKINAGRINIQNVKVR